MVILKKDFASIWKPLNMLCLFLVFSKFKMTNLILRVSTKHCMGKGGFGKALKVSAVRGKKDKAGENCC